MTRRRTGREAAMAALMTALVVAACGGAEDSATPSLARGSTSASATSGDAAERTRQAFAGIVDDEPGCSVAVNLDDEIVFAEAYGAASLDPLVPFETTTVVDIASSSKQFTAIAVGQLIVDGDVAPGDTIDTYVDDLPEWAGEVTVAQLINHTSGIPDYTDLLLDAGLAPDDAADQDDALRAIAAETELDANPGDRFQYSNSNYVLLAEVVAAVTGTDLPSWLGTELFGPLGLEAEMTPGVSLPGKAVSYEFEDDWVVADSPWTQLGDGAVQTTPSDLAAFASTYWLDGSPWDELAALRDQIGVETGEGTYSLGIEAFRVDDTVLLGHDGSWDGFETLFLLDPADRAAVAVTCNSPDAAVDLEGLAGGILDSWVS